MSSIKIGKTVNQGSANLLTGTNDADILTTLTLGNPTGDKRDYLRGSGGNDLLTAGSTSNDVFIFEPTLILNGVDIITDFNVYEPTVVDGLVVSALEDTIDLSMVFGKEVKLNGDNIGDYVRLKDDQLELDLSGSGQSWSVWAVFDNNGDSSGGGYIANGDLVHIRTSNFDGMITASISDGFSSTVEIGGTGGAIDFYDNSGNYGGYPSGFFTSHDTDNNTLNDDFRYYGLGGLGLVSGEELTGAVELLQKDGSNNFVGTGSFFDAYSYGDALGVLAPDSTFTSDQFIGGSYALRFVWNDVAYVSVI